MEARQTITEEYRREQQELHKNPHYGVASLGFAGVVKRLIEETGARSICDYGAGKCNLKRKLDEIGMKGVEYFPYDPAFPEYGSPRPADRERPSRARSASGRRPSAAPCRSQAGPRDPAPGRPCRSWRS